MRDGFGAQSLVKDRPMRALVDKLIGRDGDHEHIALPFGRLEVADVPDVQQVEDPMAMHHGLAVSAQRLNLAHEILKGNGLGVYGHGSPIIVEVAPATRRTPSLRSLFALTPCFP